MNLTEIVALRRSRRETAPPLALADDRASPISAEAARALETDLRRQIDGEVRFDSGSRALYATDASNYRQVPIGVVVPKTLGDVAATMALCRLHGAPFLSRGGGTSLAGQCCNVAVVVDYSKYLNRVISLDPERRLARVEPGAVLDDLRNMAERHHLTFGPDPSTHDHNTLGGMLGNNSCGVHSVMAGRTADNVHTLDILTYDGLRMTVGRTSADDYAAILAAGGRRAEIYRALDALRRRYGELIRERYPEIPRRVSATISTICCRKPASTLRPRWSGRRAPASPSSARRCGWCRARRSGPSPFSASPTSSPPPTLPCWCASKAASPSKRSTTS